MAVSHTLFIALVTLNLRGYRAAVAYVEAGGMGKLMANSNTRQSSGSLVRRQQRSEQSSESHFAEESGDGDGGGDDDDDDGNAATIMLGNEWHWINDPRPYPTYALDMKTLCPVCDPDAIASDGPCVQCPPLTNAHVQHNVKHLGEPDWPSDYCIDMDLKFPNSDGGYSDGHGGAIALMGRVLITVVTDSKLKSGTGVGLAATVLDDDGQVGANEPFVSTVGFGGYGQRHKCTFCYKGLSHEADFRIDGAKIDHGYVANPNKEFPDTRDSARYSVGLSVLAAGHNDTTEQLPDGGELWKFEIRPYYPWPLFKLMEDEITQPQLGIVTLSDTSYPQDYCIHINLTLPAIENGETSGLEGTIALLGTVQLGVTHSSGLYDATGSLAETHGKPLNNKKRTGPVFGFAVQTTDGTGPVYGTEAVAEAGERKHVVFCYDSRDLTPAWSIDGHHCDSDCQGYISGARNPLPVGHNVPVTLLSGSSDGVTQALVGATLHSLEIHEWRINSNIAGPVDFQYNR